MKNEQNQTGAPVLQDFTLEEQQQILDVAGTIRPADQRAVSAYGTGAQKHLEEVNRQMASFAAARAPEQTAGLLQELMEALQQAKAAENELEKEPGAALRREAEKTGFFEKIRRFRKKNRPAEEAASVMPDPEETQALLAQHQEQLLRDRAVCRQLNRQNEKYLKELSMYIAAGRLAHQQETEHTDPADGDRLEKRLQDLMVTRAAALQTALQLQQIQEQADQLWSQLQTVEKLTLPLFQRQSGHPCPVCGQHRFSQKGSYEICPVCGWEDDPVQERDPDFSGGANRQSLQEYRAAFASKK